MTSDQPRRVERPHPIDCTCCTPPTDRLDWNGVAIRFLIGLGWGAIAAFVLSAFSGVPVL